MEAAWVQVEEDENCVVATGKVRIKYWSSSTRPELVAILGALLTTKLKFKVIIKADSEAAINSINRVLLSRSFKDILKTKNRAILNKIVEIIDSKNLVISMCKVKAYMKVRWNEFANQLAKKATLLDDLWLWPISRQTR